MANNKAMDSDGERESQLSLDLFDDMDDDGPDHVVENGILDVRGEFQGLSRHEQASLAERIIQSDLVDVLYAADDMELALIEFLTTAIRDSRIDESDCSLCDKPIEAGQDSMLEQTIWTSDARNGSQLRQDTGRLAHEECVKRVREGGDPAERPMW